MTRRPLTPRARVWYFLTYGPAGIMLTLGVYVLFAVGWVTAFAYAMAGLNMWLVARGITGNYRSGYAAGRLDMMMEQLRLKAPRRYGVDPRPAPWDDPTTDLSDDVRLREAMDRLNREAGPG